MDKYAIQKEQLNFLGKIPAKVRKSASYDMRKFAFESDRVNPPIWLLMNELTLGESIHLYKLMSKNKALCQIVLIEVNYNLIIGLSIKLLCTSLMLFL